MKTHADFLEEFKEFAEAEAQNRERWLEDLKFGFSDDQWDQRLRRQRQDDPHGARPCLTVNKIPAHARQILNDMRQSRAAIKVLPVDDRADVETAEVIQGIIRHIEHVSNADQAYSVASEYQVMMGVGYFRVDTVHSDPLYNEQEIQINTIRNPFSVYMDPWITDITGGDATACYVTTNMPRKLFEREYPKADMVNVEGKGRGDAGGWFTENAIRVAECFYLEDYEDDYVIVAGHAMKADEYDSNTYGSYDREAKMPMKRLKWQKISGKEILEEQDKPGQYIPIIRVAGEDIDVDGERIVTGIVRRARDAQQMYNFTVSAIAERNALEPKAPWLVAEESIDGHEDEFGAANRTNLPFLKYNALSEDGTPLPPPQRQFPTGANGALISQQMGADSDIQSTIGQFAASLGETSNEKSGRAIQQRQMVGDIATFHYPDNMSRAIRQCGRVIVDLLPRIYDTARVARILGEDGDSSSVALNPNIQGAYEGESKIDRIYNVGVGKYDVAVTVGPSYATKRQEAFEAMAQMTQGNPQLWGVIGDLLVSNMDWPGAQEMAKRIKATIPAEITQDEEDGEPVDPQVVAQFQELSQALEVQQQQLQELAQQNQQLTQTLENKTIEQQMKAEEYAFKRDEMAHERDLKALEHDTKAAELMLKRDEAAAKTEMAAEKNATEIQAFAELVQITGSGAAQSQEILAALAQTMQQNSEMIAAMLSEMAKPKSLVVETDADGNVTGGIARTLQ